MSPILIEGLGTLATIFLVVSLAMKDIKLLRIFNFIGGFLFIIYAIFFQAWSVIISNSLMCILNIFHLIKLRVKKVDEKYCDDSLKDLRR